MQSDFLQRLKFLSICLKKKKKSSLSANNTHFYDIYNTEARTHTQLAIIKIRIEIFFKESSNESFRIFFFVFFFKYLFLSHYVLFASLSLLIEKQSRTYTYVYIVSMFFYIS
jgi:hypothetical protein